MAMHSLLVCAVLTAVVDFSFTAAFPAAEGSGTLYIPKTCYIPGRGFVNIGPMSRTPRHCYKLNLLLKHDLSFFRDNFDTTEKTDRMGFERRRRHGSRRKSKQLKLDVESFSVWKPSSKAFVRRGDLLEEQGVNIDPNCHYVGKVSGDEESSVSLDLCRPLSGQLEIADDVYGLAEVPLTSSTTRDDDFNDDGDDDGYDEGDKENILSVRLRLFQLSANPDNDVNDDNEDDDGDDDDDGSDKDDDEIPFLKDEYDQRGLKGLPVGEMWPGDDGSNVVVENVPPAQEDEAKDRRSRRGDTGAVVNVTVCTDAAHNSALSKRYDLKDKDQLPFVIHTWNRIAYRFRHCQYLGNPLSIQLNRVLSLGKHSRNHGYEAFVQHGRSQHLSASFCDAELAPSADIKVGYTSGFNNLPSWRRHLWPKLMSNRQRKSFLVNGDSPNVGTEVHALRHFLLSQNEDRMENCTGNDRVFLKVFDPTWKGNLLERLRLK